MDFLPFALAMIWLTDRAIFGRGHFSMAWVRIGADRERLHVRVGRPFRGGGSFSVPLEDVTATSDRYGWMVLAPDTIRLRFGRAPEELMMVFPGDFARLAEASGGRLRLEAAPAPALADPEHPEHTTSAEVRHAPHVA